MMNENNVAGLLDRISQNDPTVTTDLSNILFPNVPNIYAFTTSLVPNAVKVGFTMKPVKQRIDQWKEHYPDATLIGSWSAAVLVDSMKYYVKDYPIHKEIIQEGFRNLLIEDFSKDIYFSKEFFDEISEDKEKYLTEQVLTEIINTVKSKVQNGDAIAYGFDTVEKSMLKEPDEFNFGKTQLQSDAVANGVKIYKSGENKMLLAAVMRFGKTHVGYSIVNELGLKYTLVVSAKVNTRDEWRNGIYHSDFKNFVFVEYKDSYTLYVSDRKEKQYKREISIENFDIDSYIGSGETVIVFASIQDLSGIKDSNDPAARIQKAKHEFIFGKKNDLIIIDETHYGVRGALWSKAFTVKDDNYDENLIADKKSAEKLDKIITGIPTACQFHMSGTPYYIMASHEFTKNQIVGTYSYIDMLDARDEWITKNQNTDESKSPYFGIPNMTRFALKLTKKCTDEIKKLQNNNNLDIDLSTLFKCEGQQDNLKFCYEEYIIDFMRTIFGGNDNKICGFLNDENIIRGEIFKHIVCKLPTINACHALKKLLIENNIVDADREVIVAVDNKYTGKKDACTETANDLNKYLNKLESTGKKSITLTVQRLLTGATIPYWDSMFYMSDTESPQEYDQNTFRICSRNVKAATCNGKTELINLKPYVYLVDFKINRMFKMVCDSARLMTIHQNEYNMHTFKKNIQTNIDKMPIYVDFNNTKMDSITAVDLMKYYVKYDRESSVEDIILDGLEKYDVEHFDASLLEIVNRYNQSNIKMQRKIDAVEGDGQTEMPTFCGVTNNVSNTAADTNNSDVTITNLNRNKKENEELRKRLASLLKSILYLIICIDKKINTLDELIELIKNDTNEFEKAKIFLGNDCIDVLETVKNKFEGIAKMELEEDIFRLSSLLNDPELSEYERLNAAIKKIGKLDKNEVVTSQDICEMMINKLQESKYKTVDKILELNSKVGEFAKVIYDKFGKDVVKNVTFIPSSNIAREFIKKTLRIMKLDESQCLNINSDKFLEMNSADMSKFDIILMNPPYDRDLHLKFLSKAIEVGEEVVSIQPIGWLTNPISKLRSTSQYSKYKESIAEHIKDIETLEQSSTKYKFNINIDGILGIYVCDKRGGFDYDSLVNNPITDKVIPYIMNNLCNIETNKKDKYRIKISRIICSTGGGSGNRAPLINPIDVNIKDLVFKDGMLDGKPWHEYYAKNQNSKTTNYITHSIKFETEIEGHNFVKSLHTDFGRYIEAMLITNMSVDNKKILWMGNAVNPRTKLKGYKGEWTSKDFEQFFNISEEDSQIYKKYIADFKIKRAEYFSKQNREDNMIWENQQ